MRCIPRPWLGILGALAALAAGAAGAHEAREGMATEKIVLKVAGKTRKLVFKGFGNALVPHQAEDPAEVGAAVLVRGASDDGDGRSALIDLDPARWSANTKDGELTYTYRDRKGSRGGVTRIVFRPGALVIKATGPAFPWTGPGASRRAEVFFRLGQEWHCASADGGMKRKAFLAENAFAPSECPALVCGDGTRALGEACDDGNVDDVDGCSNACTFGACEGASYQSTWEAIQAVVFARHGCTEAVCHGAAPGEGGLDLSPAVAYANLLDVPSTGSALGRLVPGAPRRSALYLKLAAKIDPDEFEIAGAPMPNNLPPIADDELEAIRLWIYNGAPETGSVEGVAGLLDACLPPPTPIEIEPLDPPAPGTGVQFRMPEFPLRAHSETEVCFAMYYDFTDQIPAQFRDPTGQFFYVNGSELRQDPHSHHMQFIYTTVPASRLDDPSFGAWTCKGGALDGQPCDPLDLTGCGEGLCGSVPTPNVACIGYGPPEYSPGLLGSILGGAQTAQNYAPPLPGFWATIPMKGVVYWNSHAFNLTDEDTRLHAYSNHYFTDDRRFQGLSIVDTSTVFYPAGGAPFAKTTVCADRTLPQGAYLMFLSSHAHKRLEHFWVDSPDGTRLYDNFDYADPAGIAFDPHLPFLSSDPAERTLHYCATYNNGVAADGSPDPATVRRRSVTPTNGAPCSPVACVSGRVGAACVLGGDATCDSTPGAGDGSCDACPITAGVTTEDEMFILIGGYVMGDISAP